MTNIQNEAPMYALRYKIKLSEIFSRTAFYFPIKAIKNPTQANTRVGKKKIYLDFLFSLYQKFDIEQNN
jgi:hypothetical protein